MYITFKRSNECYNQSVNFTADSHKLLLTRPEKLQAIGTVLNLNVKNVAKSTGTEMKCFQMSLTCL